MHDPSDSDYLPRWEEIRCPKCWANGWLTADSYGDHLLACEGIRDWKSVLTADDIAFLKDNKIDPEVE